VALAAAVVVQGRVLVAQVVLVLPIKVSQVVAHRVACLLVQSPAAAAVVQVLRVAMLSIKVRSALAVQVATVTLLYQRGLRLPAQVLMGRTQAAGVVQGRVLVAQVALAAAATVVASILHCQLVVRLTLVEAGVALLLRLHLVTVPAAVQVL